MPLNPDVKETVIETNNEVQGNGPQFHLNLALSDAVAHQRRMNLLIEAATARIMRKLDDAPVVDALAAVKTASENIDISSQISKLANTFSSIQSQFEKQSADV